MNILYIGGTGEISFACVQRGAEIGQTISVFNRGQREEKLPGEVTSIIGDLGDEAAYASLAGKGFDVVCQFLAYDPSRVERDIELFGGKVKQYVFISSASAYEKPSQSPVITEETPLVNPHWEYSRKKARMEQILMNAHDAGKLPVTIVRPSHTYRRRFPGTFVDGDHIAWRMLNGKPVISHGDGSSLWTLTHSEDFADAFVRLLGNEQAIGEAFHITSDETNPWDRILEAMGAAVGAEPQLVHIPSDVLVRYNENWEGPLHGDKAVSVIFDNTKVKEAVGGWDCRITMREGMKRVAPYFRDRLESFKPKEETEALLDKLIEKIQGV